jgi:nucleotide-binding universal stress UspA family protein
MFNRILVPLDGSPLAERAIPHAELFARVFGGSIFLLQVLEPTSYYENPRAVDPLRWQIHKAEANVYLKGIAQRIRENLGEEEKRCQVEYAIREGKAAENIIDFALSEDIDLLIISTHGSGGLSRWNISSVTQKVINMIYLPVLIVRAYSPAEKDDKLLNYHRILLPTDSSRRSEVSISAGIELARGERSASNKKDENIEKSKLFLTAVIQPPELPIPDPLPVEIKKISEKLFEITRQAVQKYLNEMKERLPVDCEIYVVESTSVTSAIQELTEKEDIDLVILSAHGYSGQVNWPYGSVTRNYIDYGVRSVLVIQDVPRSQVRQTDAEIAAEKSGRR